MKAIDIQSNLLKYADPQLKQPMSFKEKFLATPPGPAREELVYQAAIKQPLPKTVPITVSGPNGIKLTYKVLPDYLIIDGIRVPMTGITAQRIADHFGMHLPTAKMSKQIWNAADAKIKPMPMSGGAYINGKWYSAQEVVDHKISGSDTSVAFNDKINQEVEKYKDSKLRAGHMKDIVAPENAKDRLGLYGWYDAKGNPIQGGNGVTPHDVTQHTEYAASARFVGDKFTLTTPDGKKIGPITMDQLKLPQYKEYAGLIFNNPSQGQVKYNTGNTAKPTNTTTPKKVNKVPETQKPSQQNEQSMADKINEFLAGIAKMF